MVTGVVSGHWGGQWSLGWSVVTGVVTVTLGYISPLKDSPNITLVMIMM